MNNINRKCNSPANDDLNSIDIGNLLMEYVKNIFVTSADSSYKQNDFITIILSQLLNQSSLFENNACNTCPCSLLPQEQPLSYERSANENQSEEIYGIKSPGETTNLEAAPEIIPEETLLSQPALEAEEPEIKIQPPEESDSYIMSCSKSQVITENELQDTSKKEEDRSNNKSYPSVKKGLAIHPEVLETHDMIIIKIKIPDGINENSFRISVNENHALIKWSGGYIEQIVKLPPDILRDRATASVRNKVLEVQIPRAGDYNVRKVPIEL